MDFVNSVVSYVKTAYDATVAAGKDMWRDRYFVLAAFVAVFVLAHL